MRAEIHPLIWDPIESERCPDCGAPGERIDAGDLGPLQVWACRVCMPEAF